MPTVRIDRDICSGHGRCHEISERLFPLDDDGYAVEAEIAVEGTDLELATSAARVCPERAISLSER